MTPPLSRRQFIAQTTAATIGVCFVQLGCDYNSVDPIVEGRELPFLTPVDSFYVKAGAEISIGNWQQPSLSQSEWSLLIDGLVSSPRQINFDDIAEAAASGHDVNVLKTMRCVIDSNEVAGLIGTAVWSGVPLTHFLDPSDIDATARRLRIRGYDGFTNNIRVDRLAGDENAQLLPPLLVTHMNGEPLTERHGGPVRLMLNEAFGYKNVKWIQHIEVTANDAPFGTYQDAGFSDDGVIRVVSRATNPLRSAVIPAGPTRISGFAVSGFAAVDSVQVAVDDGAAVNAQTRSLSDISATDPLVASAVQVADGLPFPYRAVWTQWFLDVDFAVGSHTVLVRASDTAGNEQPESDSDITDGINAAAMVTVEAV